MRSLNLKPPQSSKRKPTDCSFGHRICRRQGLFRLQCRECVTRSIGDQRSWSQLYQGRYASRGFPRERGEPSVRRPAFPRSDLISYFPSTCRCVLGRPAKPSCKKKLSPVESRKFCVVSHKFLRNEMSEKYESCFNKFAPSNINGNQVLPLG